MLEDCPLPLQAFSCIGQFGVKSSGKTFNAFRMVDAYLEQASKHKYAITSPRDLNGPFTNIIYISPSDKTDRTLNDLIGRFTNNPGLSPFCSGLQVIPFTK